MFKPNITSKLLIVLALIAFPAVTQAATYTVTKTTDTADGTCDSDCSLREAIVAANTAGGTNAITVPAGTYTLTSSLSITSNITLTGADEATTIIDGADTYRVLSVVGATAVNINQLTIQNGRINNASGGGVYVFNTTNVTLDHVTIKSNTATASFGNGNGGGLWCNNTSLTVANSTITGNGGASTNVNGAGAFIGENCISSFDNVLVSNNLSTGNGGGVYIYNNNSSDKTFNHITFSGNQSADGGGVFIAGGVGYHDIIFTSSSFINNVSTSDGGGVDAQGSAKFTNATFYGNTANRHGGAIMFPNISYNSSTIAFSTFTHNTADNDNSSGGNGGGLYIGGGSAIHIGGSIVAGNTTIGGSGADCSASSNLTSDDYNIVGSSTSCTFSSQSNDILDPSSPTYITSATVADNGGAVQTIAISGGAVTDAVPAVSCLDASGSSLTEDARGAARPDNTNCDIGAYEVDSVAPTLSSVSPLDDATGVSTEANLVLTFNEAVTVGTGNILIKRGYNDVTYDQIDVTSDQVTGSGTTTITINSNVSLGALVGYYVVIPNTAFTDTSGNAYAGIDTSTTWNFTTAGTAEVAVTAESLYVSENSIINYFFVRLATEPTANVDVHYESLTGATEFDPAYVTFTPDNWNEPQTVFVSAVNDDVDNGTHEDDITFSSASSDSRYNALMIDTLTATIFDDDQAGISASDVTGNTTEAGGQATFTVVLDSEPVADVQIPLATSNVAEGQTNVSGITFTPDNWNTPQTVTVTGLNDTADDGDVSYAIEFGATVSADANYNGLALDPRSVINVDNDEIVVPEKIRKADVQIKVKSTGRMIRWEAVTGATYYKLKITNKQGKVLLSKKNITAYKYLLKNKWIARHLKLDKKYKVSTKACNSAGCSAWSKAKLFQR